MAAVAEAGAVVGAADRAMVTVTAVTTTAAAVLAIAAQATVEPAMAGTVPVVPAIVAMAPVLLLDTASRDMVSPATVNLATVNLVLLLTPLAVLAHLFQPITPQLQSLLQANLCRFTERV